MGLEQRMEQSEALLETNEQNKQQIEQAREQTRRATNNANAAFAQAQRCQNQLRQAEAARSAAQQQASQEEGGSMSASYDTAVAEAEAELQRALQELQEARMELAEAQEQERLAEGALEQSSRELQAVAQELQQVSQQYGVQIGNTQALMSLPHSQLGERLAQQLGIGQARLDDLRQRIATSLGVSMATAGIAGAAGANVGGYGARAGSRSRGGGNAVSRGGGGGGGSASSNSGGAAGRSTIGSGGAGNGGGGGGTLGAAAGPVMNKPARSLTDAERQSLRADTGWTDKQLKKCTIDEDGVIHYRTDNHKKEGTTSSTGVPYVRRQVQLFGRTVEGVFPVFHSYKTVQLPQNLETEQYPGQKKYCNGRLKEQVDSDPAFRAQFNELQLDQIENGITPDGYTWHHYEEHGTMQLVSRKDHDRTMKGAAHTGGDALWCCRNGAPTCSGLTEVII